MVRQSRHNFLGHCIDIFEILKDKYNLDMALKFMDHYIDVYEEHNRAFIDWKLAEVMFDERKRVQRIGTKWYACVGVGGEGKSTFMKNVLYFLDPSFLPSERVAYDWVKIIEKWSSFGDINTEKAVLLDEPDEFSWSSQEGKRLRKILGKARQGKYFFGICATDLADIPNFLFKKLDGIFWIPHQGKYVYFRNVPKQYIYTLQEIKRTYYQKGYAIFIEKKDEATICGYCTAEMPFDDIENKRYIKSKKEDFIDDMGDFIKHINSKSEKATEKTAEKIDIIGKNIPFWKLRGGEKNEG